MKRLRAQSSDTEGTTAEEVSEEKKETKKGKNQSTSKSINIELQEDESSEEVRVHFFFH